MKLYKFRPLQTEKDLSRAKYILRTDRFWCSQFSELNDPMEGVFFITTKPDKSIRWMINIIYSAKNDYKICSFCGREGFENPILWGYYAGGFKGIAIEVDIAERLMRQIRYYDHVLDVDINQLGDTIIKNILTTKLTPWKHEAEYRFLTKSEYHYHKVGKITAVYFGNPYGNLVNTNTIQKEKVNLVKYFNFQSQLVEFCGYRNIDCFAVKVSRCKVMRAQMISNRGDI